MDERVLSVVIPCYNERATIRTILARVAAVPVVRELIVVDDASRDGTADILRDIAATWPASAPPLRLVVHPRNRGKGAALRTGFAHATAPLTIVQDADLEYDPGEYPKLIQPILSGDADVVYGSRFAGFPRRVLYFWHALGNRVLTTLSNMATNLNLTDMETCYKVFKTEIIRSIPLRSDRFGFEPEVTAKIARLGCRVYEVPISYRGRTYAEGKKIGWKDGLQALWLILKYALVHDTGAGTQELTLEILRRAVKYNAWVYDLVRPHLGHDILEIGAGIGTMTRHFLKGARVTATDLAPGCLARMRRDFEAYPQVRVDALDISRPPALPAESFDSVVCLNVLEHIADDVQALRHMHRLLKPGGRAVLYVPANPRLYCEIDRGVGHHRRYTLEDLVAKLARAGFKPVHARHHNVIGAVGWWIQGRVFQKKVIAATDAGGFELVMPLARGLDRLGLQSRFSLSILAVGEKP